MIKIGISCKLYSLILEKNLRDQCTRYLELPVDVETMIRARLLKLPTSLVNVSLNFQKLISQSSMPIFFVEKM